MPIIFEKTSKLFFHVLQAPSKETSKIQRTSFIFFRIKMNAGQSKGQQKEMKMFRNSLRGEVLVLNVVKKA
ncbi:MAG: hypothetical protein EP343_27365 [Deltaproteobacteria bacterium]|nr:MAG: hypothetical protein EP343_27365 [Deltaproteobacteria bacterium]